MTSILGTIIWVGWGGFALAKLWGWYLVPLGVVPIPWWHAAGLLSVQSLLSGGAAGYAFMCAMKAADIQDKAARWVAVAMAIILPAITLGCGWLVKTLGPIVDAAL